MTRWRSERGSLTVEMVIWAVPLVLILSVIIAAGRVGMANNAVDQIAADVARIASIARTGPEAQAQATQAATVLLAEQDLDCVDLQVEVDTSGFATPAGTPAQVDVQISCTVRFDDLLIPGAPGSSTLTATASRAIDTYRERS